MSNEPRKAVGGAVGVLLGVRFLTELALVAGIAWLGVILGKGGVPSMVMAVVGIAAIGVLWGLLLAPRATRRLRDPVRLIVEIVLFGGTAAGLIVTGHLIPAVVGVVIAIGTSLAVRKFAPEP